MRYILRFPGCLSCRKYENSSKEIVDGHEGVKIGGLIWATMNIGANSEIEAGDYFAWGEIDGYTRWGKEPNGKKKSSSSNNALNYKFYDSESGTYTKYNTTDNKKKLDLEDDAAYVLWGGKWRMPTLAEVASLLKESTWVTDYEGSGRNGFLYKDSNGKVLFFPGVTNTVNPGGSYYNKLGCYWVSTIGSDGNTKHLHISPSKNSMVNSARYSGFTIRPVWDESLPDEKVPLGYYYGEDGILFRASGNNLEAFKYNGLYLCVDNGSIILKTIDTEELDQALEIYNVANPESLLQRVVTGDLKNYTASHFDITNIEKIDYPYIDLGLTSGKLWATVNLGASNPEEYGNYYMYGKDTVYNSSDDPYLGIDSGVDAATSAWGSSWYIPTNADFEELINETYSTWTTVNGVNGELFTNKTDSSKSIFIPAAGSQNSLGSLYLGTHGYLRSSTVASQVEGGDVYYVHFSESIIEHPSGPSRELGYSVRPIRNSD